MSAILLFIYAALTFWQGCLTREIAKLTQRTYDTSQRPYIGISEINKFYIYIDKSGVQRISQEQIKEATGFDFRAVIKNFGPVPGTNFKPTWRQFINDVELKSALGSTNALPSLYPSDQVYFEGAIRGDQFKSIMDKTSIFDLEVTIEYDGPTGHYPTECGKHRFVPELNAFANLGKCTH
jgi:hypothetical protein